MGSFQFGIEPSGSACFSRIMFVRSALCGLLALSLVACSGTDGDGGDGIATFKVTPSAGENVGISPASALAIQPGYITSFTLSPDAGYEIDSVTGCNGTLTGNTYTTGAITADCTVAVSSIELLPPDAPSLSLTPAAVKNFSFNWTDVSSVTEYRLLENPDGMSGYAQVATIDADATDHDHQVFLPGRINASYILQACNSAGCNDSEPVFVSGTLAEAVGYVKASNTGGADKFGYSVTLSGDGNTLAVGAPFESSDATGINGFQGNGLTDSGAVYIFTRNGANWLQQAYIKAANTGLNDEFGHSVSLSGDGNVLAVGAWFEDSNALVIDGDQSNDSAIDSGAVYVFTRSGDNWSQQAYVKASNSGAGDQFGRSVALSNDGNTLAVGAPLEASKALGSTTIRLTTRPTGAAQLTFSPAAVLPGVRTPTSKPQIQSRSITLVGASRYRETATLWLWGPMGRKAMHLVSVAIRATTQPPKVARSTSSPEAAPTGRSRLTSRAPILSQTTISAGA